MNPLLLLKPQYLFDPTPGSSFLYFWPVLILFVLLFAGSWLAKNQISKHRHIEVARQFLGGIPARMREFAFVGLILTFFRWQNIPILGMRVWIILLCLAGVFYAVWVWRHYQNNFRKSLRSLKSQELEDLYLPKPKKKRKKK